MTIFERIAQTRQTFARFDDYAQESLATGCLLNDVGEWANLLRFRNLGWNYGLIADSDHRDLYMLIQASPEQFNKQPIPVRLTIVEMLLDVQEALRSKGII